MLAFSARKESRSCRNGDKQGLSFMMRWYSPASSLLSDFSNLSKKFTSSSPWDLHSRRLQCHPKEPNWEKELNRNKSKQCYVSKKKTRSQTQLWYQKAKVKTYVRNDPSLLANTFPADLFARGKNTTECSIICWRNNNVKYNSLRSTWQIYNYDIEQMFNDSFKKITFRWETEQQI